LSPDLLFLASLAAKMAVTALLLVVATLTAERSGPVVGALIATLPISTGLGYVFLALDHDDAFIASGMLASFAVNVPSCIFVILYVILAQRFRLAFSVIPAIAVWFLAAAAIRDVDWTATSAIVANVAAFLFCLPIGNRFRHAPIRRVARRWFDVPLRAAMVAILVAVVITVSKHVGPALTGILVAFPISLFSLMLIFHPRLGGPGAAAVLANCMLGMIGYALFCLTVHLTAVPLGTPAGLCVGLAVNVASNLGFWAIHRKLIKA